MDSNLVRSYIIDIYNNPKNYGVIKDCDLKKKGYNALCGDNIEIFLKIKDGKISDISFISSGCIISKVSASILTEIVKGKKVSDIKKNLKFEDIKDKLLIELSLSREKCAKLSFETLENLLKDL
jgi:nitrogen fixation NifU-like protein